MPIYDFLCKCGRLEEAFVKSSVTEHPCPSCGGMAQRQLSAGVQVEYQNNTKTSLAPQQTGVSELDMKVDRVVREDARQKWDVIEARADYKRKVLAEHDGATMADLSRQDDGTYRVMSQRERQAAEMGRGINNSAMQRLRQGSGDGG